jgi:hypothetical protein
MSCCLNFLNFLNCLNCLNFLNSLQVLGYQDVYPGMVFKATVVDNEFKSGLLVQVSMSMYRNILRKIRHARFCGQ